MKKTLLSLIVFFHSACCAEVYDCFPFWKELEILKIRLEELHDVVDHFVIKGLWIRDGRAFLFHEASKAMHHSRDRQ